MTVDTAAMRKKASWFPPDAEEAVNTLLDEVERLAPLAAEWEKMEARSEARLEQIQKTIDAEQKEYEERMREGP